MMPIVDGLEVEFEGRVPVLRLNANEDGNAQLQADFGLRGHPAFVVLDRNSQVTESYFGPQTAETFRQAMTNVAASE
jgi:thioredoxin-like negative regulator of GroEL